jgi:hypothetical protein
MNDGDYMHDQYDDDFEQDEDDEVECGLMPDLKALSDAAEAGPWAYRPNEFDDWGLIRGGQRPDDAIGQCWPPVANAKPLWGDYDFDAHRSAKTDPMEANGRFIVELVNAYREGRLVDAKRVSWLESVISAAYDEMKSGADSSAFSMLQAARLQIKPVVCQDCGGTGWRDTGGVQPWGEAIIVVCDCDYAQSQMGASTPNTKEQG